MMKYISVVLILSCFMAFVMPQRDIAEEYETTFCINLKPLRRAITNSKQLINISSQSRFAYVFELVTVRLWYTNCIDKLLYVLFYNGNTLADLNKEFNGDLQILINMFTLSQTEYRKNNVNSNTEIERIYVVRDVTNKIKRFVDHAYGPLRYEVSEYLKDILDRKSNIVEMSKRSQYIKNFMNHLNVILYKNTDFIPSTKYKQYLIYETYLKLLDIHSANITILEHYVGGIIEENIDNNVVRLGGERLNRLIDEVDISKKRVRVKNTKFIINDLIQRLQTAYATVYPY